MARIEPSSENHEKPGGLDRRAFLGALGALGVTSAVFAGSLWEKLRFGGRLTVRSIAEAEKLAELIFTPQEREMMVQGLTKLQGAYADLRSVPLPIQIPPAVVFDPLPLGRTVPTGESYVRASVPPTLPDPAVEADVAFASVAELGSLLRARSLTSAALTRTYLDRLRRFDPVLQCSITLTDELALEQAERADREFDAGYVRGPLQGIPWGAKDLLAVRGYPTTWGAAPLQGQRFDYDATVVQKLDDAGAVLASKLALGELASDDRRFGSQTRNPWNLEVGSGGSSSGSAAATAAGLVGFSLGSETFGSMMVPASRCGATALRPTFGRVSRFGAMSLSWSMDKIGPMCRSAEDCALVFAAIQGPDGKDRSVRPGPFVWDGSAGVEGLRVGVLLSTFEEEGGPSEADLAVIATLGEAGAQIVPVTLPREYLSEGLMMIYHAEAAASFDELTRMNADDGLLDQGEMGWPNALRVARFIGAVEYLRAQRIRSLLMESLDQAWGSVDVVVSASSSRDLMVATNLTGHPLVIAPHAVREDDTPICISFVGGLWKDAEALCAAHVFQRQTGFHLRRPPGFA